MNNKDKDNDYIVKTAEAMQELENTVFNAYRDLFIAIIEELEKRVKEQNKNE